MRPLRRAAARVWGCVGEYAVITAVWAFVAVFTDTAITTTAAVLLWAGAMASVFIIDAGDRRRRRRRQESETPS